MSKCIICGRHGLFLKLNTLGQCESCAYELEQKEIGLFNDYYTRMLHTWNEARKEQVINWSKENNTQFIDLNDIKKAVHYVSMHRLFCFIAKLLLFL